MSDSAIVRDLHISGNASILKDLAPDEVAVVSGPKKGVQLIEPGTPIDLLGLWMRQYRRVYVVKTSAFQKTWTQVVLSADAPFDFELTVRVSAKVGDPKAFVSDYGAQGTVFVPFEEHLRAELAQLAQTYHPSQLQDLQQRLKSVADLTKSGDWYANSVQVLTCDLGVQPGPETLRVNSAINQQLLLEELGPEYFLLAGRDAELAKVQQSRRDQEQYKRENIERAMSWIQTLFPNDPVLQEEALNNAGFRQALSDMISSPSRNSLPRPKGTVIDKLLPSEQTPQRFIEHRSAQPEKSANAHGVKNTGKAEPSDDLADAPRGDGPETD